MNGKTYGYIRVSSRDQNEDRQRVAMQEFGIPDELVFMDKLAEGRWSGPWNLNLYAENGKLDTYRREKRQSNSVSHTGHFSYGRQKIMLTDEKSTD